MSATFDPGPNFHEIGPRNRQWIRNIRGQAYATEPYMFVASTAPEDSWNGNAAVKYLEPGTVVAALTDGSGIGPFDTTATDGRGDVANIVGICNTFLPDELNKGNHTVGVVTANVTAYESVVIEHNAGAPIPVTATTMDALRTRSLDILFTA